MAYPLGYSPDKSPAAQPLIPREPTDCCIVVNGAERINPRVFRPNSRQECYARSVVWITAIILVCIASDDKLPKNQTYGGSIGGTLLLEGVNAIRKSALHENNCDKMTQAFLAALCLGVGSYGIYAGFNN